MFAFNGVAPIISLIVAIIATILAFIFIVPDKCRAKLNGFGKFLHDTLNFKYLIVEKILQALYIFATAYVIISGFCMLFMVVDVGGYYYSRTVWYGGYGLLTMIIGPIVIRLIYEFLMMTIILIKNVIQINNKLKNQNSDDKSDPFSATIELPKKAEDVFCANCGTKVEGDFCPNCGTKVK